MPARIMVDCAHANSNKNHERQPGVAKEVVNQITSGNESIIGLMLESNIGAGNQKMAGTDGQLNYGVSITDACVDWPTTEKTLLELHRNLKQRCNDFKSSVPATSTQVNRRETPPA